MKSAVRNRAVSTSSCAMACALLFVFVISGCGSSYSAAPPPPPDTIAPSAPASLVATVVSDTQVNLSWIASTDNVGVTGYKVERCQGSSCSAFAQIAAPATTSFNDTGLTPSTSYSYRIRATDAAANLSAFSSTATAVTTNTGATVTITASPKRSAITTGQTQPFVATVTGAADTTVTWAVDTINNGNATIGTIDANGKYTPPTTGGTHTVTATSNADITKNASSSVAVTDLAGVYTYHNDLSRDGVNTKEFALTTSTVKTATFGKLFSCNMDGSVYAQPLWVANFTIAGVKHNVLLAVSMRSTVYLFDADASPCVTYWSKSMIPAGESVVTNVDVSTNDIFTDIGILGTPVIDSATNAVYLVSKTKTAGNVFHQRLHALNLLDGSERANSPVDITSAITVSGSGDTGDSSCPAATGRVPFCPLRENQRPGLALANGIVYAAWASHGDNGPYHGWIMGFNASTLAPAGVFNSSPNGRQGGIWMSGGAPAVDSAGHLYAITGNGNYDGVTDFGDSILQLNVSSSAITLNDWFTPSNQASLDSADADLGSGGAIVLIDIPGAPVGHQHLMVGGGKGAGFNGEIYILNRDNMGQNTASDGGVAQEFSTGSGLFSTPAFWNNTMYVGPVGRSLQAYALNTGSGLFNSTATSLSPTSFGFPGTTPSISASGTTNGIVWAINANACGGNASNCNAGGPAVLHAYDATNLATELWNSSQGTGNTAGVAVKFTVPTIANGKVYIPTNGDDTTTNSPTVLGRIDIYGLLPN